MQVSYPITRNGSARLKSRDFLEYTRKVQEANNAVCLPVKRLQRSKRARSSSPTSSFVENALHPAGKRSMDVDNCTAFSSHTHARTSGNLNLYTEGDLVVGTSFYAKQEICQWTSGVSALLCNIMKVTTVAELVCDYLDDCVIRCDTCHERRTLQPCQAPPVIVDPLKDTDIIWCKECHLKIHPTCEAKAWKGTRESFRELKSSLSEHICADCQQDDEECANCREPLGSPVKRLILSQEDAYEHLSSTGHAMLFPQNVALRCAGCDAFLHYECILDEDRQPHNLRASFDDDFTGTKSHVCDDCLSTGCWGNSEDDGYNEDAEDEQDSPDDEEEAD
jgi:hypothetical protein